MKLIGIKDKMGISVAGERRVGLKVRRQGASEKSTGRKHGAVMHFQPFLQ